MAEAKVRMDSLESKLDRVLALLDPRNEKEDGKKSGRAATNPMLPSVGMTQYVEEIEGLRKKLRATQDELAMAHQFLRKKQVKMYSEQKVEKGGTSPRITRRGSMEVQTIEIFTWSLFREGRWERRTSSEIVRIYLNSSLLFLTALPNEVVDGPRNQAGKP
eukprot:1381343-Amorphochlora_amoeboformis.AAC.1